MIFTMEFSLLDSYFEAEKEENGIDIEDYEYPIIYDTLELLLEPEFF